VSRNSSTSRITIIIISLIKEIGMGIKTGNTEIRKKENISLEIMLKIIKMKVRILK
jgi:hypothetical protein